MEKIIQLAGGGVIEHSVVSEYLETPGAFLDMVYTASNRVVAITKDNVYICNDANNGGEWKKVYTPIKSINKIIYVYDEYAPNFGWNYKTGYWLVGEDGVYYSNDGSNWMFTNFGFGPGYNYTNITFNKMSSTIIISVNDPLGNSMIFTIKNMDNFWNNIPYDFVATFTDGETVINLLTTSMGIQASLAITSNGNIWYSNSTDGPFPDMITWNKLTQTVSGANGSKNYLGVWSDVHGAFLIPDSSYIVGSTTILKIMPADLSPNILITAIPKFTANKILNFVTPVSKFDLHKGLRRYIYVGESKYIYTSTNLVDWTTSYETAVNIQNETFVTFATRDDLEVVHFGTNCGNIFTRWNNSLLTSSPNTGKNKFKATTILNLGETLIVPMNNRLFNVFTKDKGWVITGVMDLNNPDIPKDFCFNPQNGMFLIRDDYKTYYSGDLIHWDFGNSSPIANNTTLKMTKLKVVNGYFVALFGINGLYYSTDGMSWTKNTAFGTNKNLSNIDFYNGVWVLTLKDGRLLTSTSTSAISSADWTNISLTGATIIDDIKYIAHSISGMPSDTFVAISDTNKVWVATVSGGATNWIYVRTLGYNILNLIFLGQYLALGPNTNIYRTMPEGNSWNTFNANTDGGDSLGYLDCTIYKGKAIFICIGGSLSVGTPNW